MFKRLLLGGALAALATPGLAQTAPLAAAPDSIPTMIGRWYLPHYQSSATVADSTGALLSLYVRKRSSAWLYLLGLPVGAAALQPNESSTGSVTTKTPPEGWRIALGIPLVAASAGGYIARLATYSKTGLQQVQRDYESGKPVPARLRRRLKPKDFANAAAIRVSIVQQMQYQQALQAQKAARKQK
ncbi:hypothetical protein LJ737_12085 [Hymenobacter sp. 15J16-1T3B]|uniref:hypothetical protein n=1 Tax=Hymenobacter sp. 15J16-1T3B TaxID=2886941 RepID=UPI001D10A921|nr:hypothetical protein [Hymenobacter sp. 15J16-1T3B]MCC3157981.1 hypothetical protein [Hymenobacter sp. 15J16-1T3B]